MIFYKLRTLFDSLTEKLNAKENEVIRRRIENNMHTCRHEQFKYPHALIYDDTGIATENVPKPKIKHYNRKPKLLACLQNIPKKSLR